MTLMSRGMPFEYRKISLTASSPKRSLFRAPAALSLRMMYSAVSCLLRGLRLNRREIRCLSCRNSFRASVVSSSGWPRRITCRSLAFGVSRLVSSRTSSSRAGESVWASSTMRTTRSRRA